MPFELGVVEAGKPAPHRLDLATVGHGRPGGRDQLGRHLHVPGRLGVGDRPPDQAVLAVPTPGAPVQLGGQLRLPTGELGPQVLGEQVVVAPGQPLLVEGDDEQVGALQLPQRHLRVAAADAVRAEHSEAVSSSRTQVCSRKPITASGWRARTSSLRKSATWRLVPVNRSTKASGCGRSRSERAAR
jgi:hypothetical protein